MNSRTFRRASAGLLTAATAVLAGRARGDTVAAWGTALTWNAPAQCPTEASVRAELETLLEGSTRDFAKPDFRANAHVQEVDGHFRLDLTTTGSGSAGHRDLEAETCEEIASATTLIVGFMIDPEAAAKYEASQPTTIPGRIPATPPAPEPRPVALAPATSSRPAEGELGAIAAMAVGLLPRASFGAGIELGGRIGQLRMVVAALHFFGSEGVASTDAAAHGTFSAFAIGASLCALLPDQRFELGLCAGGEWARLLGRGTAGVEFVNKAATADFGTMTLGPRIALPISHEIALSLRLEAVAPLRRPEFIFDGVGLVHRPAAMTGRLLGGLEVVFH